MSAQGAQLIAIVRRKAAERPEYVYEPVDGNGGICRYVHDDGKPGCIIGQALYEAGLIDSTFAADTHNTGTFYELVDRLQLSLEPHEVAWLRDTQWCQDRGDPWSLAVETADDRVQLNTSLAS